MSTTHDFHAAATCSGIDPGVLGRASRPVVTGCRRRASASVQSPPAFPLWRLRGITRPCAPAQAQRL